MDCTDLLRAQALKPHKTLLSAIRLTDKIPTNKYCSARLSWGLLLARSLELFCGARSMINETRENLAVRG